MCSSMLLSLCCYSAVMLQLKFAAISCGPCAAQCCCHFAATVQSCCSSRFIAFSAFMP
ncbi:hypothetical protein SLEP1_g46972 [Rubroshorea leprosula]|uniref:Secreted protein n=1 Tax=Rubroshorea leprosula TaxID=152421 RepID=A0AAV5LPR0_9ROSI|nr:hypothetical protein SLEP1_g46972 [Rubroshorea leprosula]